VTLALYRAYRPGTLAEVVGQEHVTAPLRRALATDRIHHAYLFSGPRGCGKTSTARILARSLNCEQGPTPDPCGRCASCVALAPNGPGSEDVIELDAASHGGVDDTRELRERVIYTPTSSRYRIYIIDEAHMVTTQGFNALLKVIEEPPAYVRFIFATTEPDKVLGTIRSRTFNYAFRLVATSVLATHLARVCEAEQVPYDPAALPMVAKASGGSVRDALSLLGQLIAGSADDGLTYGFVAQGLGLTDAALLDRVVAAIAARDGAAVFTAVDAVIESGHESRRFLTDLLQRMRDLVVLRHVPQADHAALLDLPAEQVAGLREQAALFGDAELARAADLVSAGLSEVKGATAPRLQLELLMGRLLLPAADTGLDALAARLDQFERRLAAVAAHEAGVGRSAPAPRSATPVAPVEPPLAAPPPTDPQAGAQLPGAPQAGPPQAGPPPAARPAGAPRPAPAPAARPVRTPPPRLSDIAPATAAGGPARTAAPPDRPAPAPGRPPAPASAQAPAAAAGQAASAQATAPAQAATPAGPALAAVAARWPEVLTELGRRSRVAWTAWESSVPVSLDGKGLTVAVGDQGRLSSIKASRREELLRQVIIDLLRLDVAVLPTLRAERPPSEESGASLDDPDAADDGLTGVDLVMKEFGAVPIGEIGDR
jgi:DNA polymerase-3 subunit gamma/tau